MGFLLLLWCTSEKRYWVHHPYVFHRNYCITLGIGFIFWATPPCIVAFFSSSAVHKKFNYNPNPNNKPNPNPNGILSLVFCWGQNSPQWYLSCRVKKVTTKATLYAGCLNSFFFYEYHIGTEIYTRIYRLLVYIPDNLISYYLTWFLLSLHMYKNKC